MGDWSDADNFTIDSLLNITLLVDTVNFTGVLPDTRYTTVNDSPAPFILENSGNLPVNITVNGTRLFQHGIFPTANYTFKIADNETSSFDPARSTITFTNMTNASARIDIADLDWYSGNNSVRSDINFTMPGDEPATAHSSTLIFAVQ
jgi:hypothetical protein